MLIAGISFLQLEYPRLIQRMNCLQLPTPDTKGHLQRGISRTLEARAFLDILASCGHPPPDDMRVVLGSGRGLCLCFWHRMIPASVFQLIVI
jgi:hypothetical protein